MGRQIVKSKGLATACILFLTHFGLRIVSRKRSSGAS